jgi:hypothetical protein
LRESHQAAHSSASVIRSVSSADGQLSALKAGRNPSRVACTAPHSIVLSGNRTPWSIGASHIASWAEAASTTEEDAPHLSMTPAVNACQSCNNCVADEQELKYIAELTHACVGDCHNTWFIVLKLVSRWKALTCRALSWTPFTRGRQVSRLGSCRPRASLRAVTCCACVRNQDIASDRIASERGCILACNPSSVQDKDRIEHLQKRSQPASTSGVRCLSITR